MALDKYSRLKIASNILDESITSMAESWGVTLQSVKGVCEGKITSERLSNNIDAKIKQSEDIFDRHRSNKVAAKHQ